MMRKWLGLLTAIVTVMTGILIERRLHSHLLGASNSAKPRLTAPLDTFPDRLTHQGREWSTPQESAWPVMSRPNYLDEMFCREYIDDRATPRLQLYLLFSDNGADREHHPEYCLGAARRVPELTEARQRIQLDPDEGDAQRFYFQTGASQGVTVYYWHYTLESRMDEGGSFIQQIHQRSQSGKPSLTVHVNVFSSVDECLSIEESFLPFVHKTLRSQFLPAEARLGCDRVPVHYRRLDSQ